ncbi:MAG: universal stress protein [Chromatiales bacterium]|nr:universal stress protein [Gammaproteobacteria bacterium]MCP5352222.1 universal stress protein [Chromatiales bacterium]
MNRFQNILFVVEPNATPEQHIDRAISLAHNNQARLTVIDVAPPLPGGLTLPAGAPDPATLESRYIAERRAALEQQFAARAGGLELHVDVRLGTRFLEVIRAVLRDGNDLVIKPAEDPNWMNRLFGSDDLHLLRKCPCPVWLMKPGGTPRYRRIVAAVDVDLEAAPDATGDALSLDILRLASSQAIADGAELHVVHAWDTPEAGLVRIWADDPERTTKNLVDALRNRHQSGLDALLNRFRELPGGAALSYLEPTTHLPMGSARTAIPDLIRAVDADLVVMGTVARGGIPGFFIGNTAEAIVEQLECAVLAIKPTGFRTPVTLPD